MKTIAILFLSSLGIIGNCADIFVDNVKGSAKGNGKDQPFININQAVTIAKPGDRVVIANTGKPYTHSISVRHKNGLPGNPIIFEGNGALITGLKAIAADKWEAKGNNVFFFKHPYHGALNPYLVHDGKPVPVVKKLKDLTPGKHIWRHEGVYVIPPQGQTMKTWKLSGTLLASGFAVHNSNYITCRNLRSHYFSNDGFNIHGNCRGLYFENIESASNGDDGFSIHEDVGAVVQGGHFHHNNYGIQDVNASRSVFTGVLVENNRIDGAHFAGGYHSLVDSIVRNNRRVQVKVSVGMVKHLGFAKNNPMAESVVFLKNLYIKGGEAGLRVMRDTKVSMSHCIISGSEMGINVAKNATCHLTASVIADSSKHAVFCVSGGNLTMWHDVIGSGQITIDGKNYNASDWSQLEASSPGFKGNILKKPVFDQNGFVLKNPAPLATVYRKRVISIGPDKAGIEILKTMFK